MFRAQFVLASPWCRLFPVAVLAAFSLLHAQENPSEMLQVLSVSPDSVKVQDSAQVAPVAESDSSANQVVADSTSAQDTVAVQAPADSAVNAASVSKPLKSVVVQRLLPGASEESGAVPAWEVLFNTQNASTLIRSGEFFKLPSIIAASASEGMMLMDGCIVELVKSGYVAREEAERYVSSTVRFG